MDTDSFLQDLVKQMMNERAQYAEERAQLLARITELTDLISGGLGSRSTRSKSQPDEHKSKVYEITPEFIELKLPYFGDAYLMSPETIGAQIAATVLAGSPGVIPQFTVRPANGHHASEVFWYDGEKWVIDHGRIELTARVIHPVIQRLKALKDPRAASNQFWRVALGWLTNPSYSAQFKVITKALVEGMLNYDSIRRVPVELDRFTAGPEGVERVLPPAPEPTPKPEISEPIPKPAEPAPEPTPEPRKRTEKQPLRGHPKPEPERDSDGCIAYTPETIPIQID